MYFTDEQSQAIQMQDCNLIVTAGAGSGKTRVLVERFLGLLENNPDWKLTELVAITFTEKAAREMRDRVREAIQQRVQADTARWREHDAAMDNARIGTIHSLCAQILRSNPARVPVDPEFEVLDENDARLLQRDAIEEALVALAASDTPDLLLHYELREIRAVLYEYVANPEGQALVEGLPASPDDLLTQWGTQHEELAQQALANLEQDTAFWAALNWTPPTGWPTDDDKLMQTWLHVHALMPDLQNSSDIRTTLETLTSRIKLNVGSAKNWGDKAILDESKNVLRGIREIAKAYLDKFPPPFDEFDAAAASMLLHWGEAIQLARQIYARLKDERNALDFDDLEVKTRDLLRKHPNVAQRYTDAEFKHLLVDEFQDTNARQRDIVNALCGAAAGRLFVVGDPKQSIYAFRGADVSVFYAVRDEIVSGGGTELPLSRSFRAHERLVAAFNELFTRLLEPQFHSPYEVQYDMPMSAQRLAQDWHQRPIEFIGLTQPAHIEQKLYAAHFRRWEAHEIAAAVHQMVAAGTSIYDKQTDSYRPMQYGDVAILFRAMTHVPLYEEIFKAQGLPYVTIAGRGYYDRQEVWDMLNLLRALHNPADNLALASVLRSPLFGLSDDALFALRHFQREVTLWEAVQHPDLPLSLPRDTAQLTFAREVLAQLAGMAGRVTVDELLDAPDATAYDAILTALPDGDRRRGNLDKLLQKARESGRVSLNEFLLYWHDLTSVEPREGEAAIEDVGAVKLMSVHKSKGLEFPVVVLANADWISRSRVSMAFVVDPQIGGACRVYNDDDEKVEPFAYSQAKRQADIRDLAEHKRLLYVAATRAQDYLLITGRASDSDKSWMGMLANVLGIDGAGHYPPQEPFAHVTFPMQPPEAMTRPQADDVSDWDMLAAQGEGAMAVPTLLRDLGIHLQQQARHLSVTQLEELGAIPYYEPDYEGRRKFRQSVLHDAPGPIYPLQYFHDQSRIIGTVVHRALRMGAFQKSGNGLEEILKAYAWNEGITDGVLLEEVVSHAIDLLAQYHQRGEPETLKNAGRVLREVPFIYRMGERIIHGVVDVLYQYGERWYVLDYKTAPVGRTSVNWHAQRYYIQLGAYAQAVAARTGQTPTVQLYYLHSGVLIEIEEGQWRGALQELEKQISAALAH